MSDYTAAAAVCADGLTSKTFEERSAGRGKAVDTWRREVVDALKTAKEGDATARKKVPLTKDVASRFNALGNAISPDPASGKAPTVSWSTPEHLDALLDGKVKGFEDFGSYTERERPMWAYLKKKGLAYEADWQHTTAASFVQKVTKDGKETRVTRYVEADKIPYVVRRGTYQPPMGSYVKVTAPNGNSVYARVLEAGPKDEGTEASLKVWEALGYAGVTPSAAPAKTLTYDNLGTPPKGALNTSFESGYLSHEEIQLAGALVESGDAKHVATHQDLFDAMTKKHGDEARAVAKKAGVEFPKDMKPTPERPAAPEKPAAKPTKKGAKAKKTAGGPKLERGFVTVAIGPELRRAGYADAACTHTGGGSVREGAHGVYVGRFPLARVGDGTTDGLAIVTGCESVVIGGPPTTAKLA
jgi:hypothetical protein